MAKEHICDSGQAPAYWNIAWWICHRDTGKAEASVTEGDKGFRKILQEKRL